MDYILAFSESLMQVFHTERRSIPSGSQFGTRDSNVRSGVVALKLNDIPGIYGTSSFEGMPNFLWNKSRKYTDEFQLKRQKLNYSPH